MGGIKPIPGTWVRVLVILLVQTENILGCMDETAYQNDCRIPFSEWIASDTLFPNLCNTASSQGDAVFNCMRDELECGTHDNKDVQEEFRQRFQGLRYNKPVVCEAYDSQTCYDTVQCALGIYNYTSTDLYGFYDFFCGHSNDSTIKRAIDCSENTKTNCPKTFEFINSTAILNSGPLSLTFGDLNERIVLTECPKVTASDVACLTEKGTELGECGVETSVLTDNTIECGYVQVSGQCMTTVCSSTLSDFFISLFEYIQCGVQRIACAAIQDGFGFWKITLVGEQAVIECDAGLEGAYRRTCHGGGTWGTVTGSCTTITEPASSTNAPTSTSTSTTASTTTTTLTTTTTTTTEATTSTTTTEATTEATTTTTTTEEATTTTTAPPTTTTPIDVTEALAALDGLVDTDGDGGEEPPSEEEVQKLGRALQDVSTGLRQQMQNNETVTIDDEDTDTILDAADQLLKPDSLQFLKAPHEADGSTVDGGVVLEAMETLLEATQERVCGNLAPGGSKQSKRDNLVLEFGKKTGADIVFPGGSDSYKANIEIPAQTIANQGIGELCFGGLYYPTIKDALEPGDTIGGYDEGSTESVSDAVVNSDVVSINLNKLPGVSYDNLDPPVKVIFDLDDKNLTDPICVYWDFNGNKWSRKGCRLTTSEDSKVTCECSHLTNFAILMSPKKISGSHAKALSIISAVGCGLSILCLLLTIIIHWIVWRLVRSDRSVILMNVCVVLLLGLILFLAGVNRTESTDACKAIALLLQFLFLTVFFLMLLTGIEILISIVHVYTTKFRIKILLPLSYLIPAIIVGISYGVTKGDGYGTEEFCWLDVQSGLIWAFIGPVLFVIFVNFIVVLVVFKKMASTTLLKNKGLKSKVQTSVRSVCVLVPVMGLAWILGVVSVNSDTPIFAYLFAIFNTLQGLFIFLMHCVFNRQVQDAIKHKQARRKSMRSFTASYRNQSQSRSFSADHDAENPKRRSQISYIKDGSENSSNSEKNKKKSRKKSDGGSSYSGEKKHSKKSSWPAVRWT